MALAELNNGRITLLPVLGPKVDQTGDDGSAVGTVGDTQDLNISFIQVQ